MANLKHFAQHGRYPAEIVFGCLSVVCFASAQSQTSDSRPLVLAKKDATSLILAQAKPDYPALAKVNYIQGRVSLQLLVSCEGKVTEANVVQGHPFLAVAALNAVRHWLYRPLQSPSGPIPFVTTVEVNFTLRHLQLDKLPPEPLKDLNRSVRPPQVLSKPSSQSHLVHLRVLVDEDGQVIDVSPIEGFPSNYSAAMKMAEHFRFEPARWGSLTVPWYLEVECPEESTAAPVPASID
jgi:TonB family protein